jgi:GAF domain-containing protein/anti-sigma regulatory factor (Ser/Thr protein kinase)
VEILHADTAAILLIEGGTDEVDVLVARAARGLEEEIEAGFSLPVGQGFAGRVAAERRPVAIPDLRPGDAVNPLLYEKKLRSLLGVPLVVEGRLIGVLHVGTLSPRDFTGEDTALLQIVADRAALSIEHARAYEAERRARTAAEKARARLEQLQAVTDAALAHLDLDDLLSVLLERVTTIVESDTAAILLAEDDGTTLAARAAKGLEEEVRRGFKLPIGTGFAGRVGAERRAVALRDVGPHTVSNPLLYEKGIASLLGVPLVVEGRLIGVLHVGTFAERVFTEDDIELLQLVADRAALAIEHDRLFQQRRVAEALQRTLLPANLESSPGISVAARYIPAAVAASVGGDWYDLIPLHDGRVGLAIGDVVGHGVEAATLMGALRNALHAYALEGLPPAGVAPRIARFAERHGERQMATYIYAVLAPGRDAVRFVNGSHPKPLLVRPDGTAEFVSSPILPPLGVPGPVVAEEAECRLEPGETLLFYTDGLVERRGERLATRQQRLKEVAAAAPFAPDLLCDAVLEHLLGDGPPADDVALLAVQRSAVGGRNLELTVAARAEELAAIRRLLRDWLAEAGAGGRDVSAILLASGEACSNAMEHAYGPGDQTFDLAAEVSGEDVVLEVRDNGRWRAPRGTNRGRGLGLMEAFMDEVEVIPGDAGTTVRMRRRLTG